MVNRLVTVAVLAATIGCATEGPRDGADIPRDSFPPGPFGQGEGDTLRNHTFTNPDGAPVTLQELRADQAARLLLVVTAAGWCTACIEEQPALQRLHERHGPGGLRVLVTVFEDSEFAPARPADAAEWASDHALTFPVVADPEFQLRDYYDASLTPMNMLVDLGPMTIQRITTGWDPTLIESLVEALL